MNNIQMGKGTCLISVDDNVEDMDFWANMLSDWD